MRFAILLVSLSLAFAQKDEPQKTTFEGEPALVLSNGALELTVLPKGSTFARLIMTNDAEKMSPLWDPIRMAREAGEKDIFQSSLGHFVCVDGFGSVSSEEEAAGLPGHGEAHERPFEMKFYGKEGRTTTLTLATKLPLTGRSEEHTSELQSHSDLVCRLLLEKKKKTQYNPNKIDTSTT